MSKNIIFLSLLVLSNISSMTACDVCGCSIGNGFSSILPQFNKNFIGLRGSFARYNSHHPDDFENINYEKSSSMEVWGRFYIHKRIQLIAVLPYNTKSQTEKGVTTTVSGLGDASATINYTVINKNVDSFKWKHLLLVGAGIKLPTGKNDISENNTLLNIYLQPGSGSFDYLFNMLYTVRHNKLGLSNDVQYRINYANSSNYEFGNKFSYIARAFYWQNINKSCNLLPSAGVLLESFAKDYNNGFVQNETGGTINSLTVGCELYYKKLLFSINYNQPITQNLSDGNVQMLSKLNMHASFLF